MSPRFLFATALALSTGWGIRGNFGHEYGAMIPGALAAMAAALLSGREDWHRRIPLFGFFGAIGWSFGGSISYMQVIAYTHSGNSPSVLYGFACLFVIGFLWGATGGAATALPALFSRARLDSFMPAIIAVFIGWTLQDVTWWFGKFDSSDFRHENWFYWYDTDWLGVSVALLAVVVCALIRRKWDEGCSLVFHMGVGWWIGFLILVNVMGLRMTPPRGDNWSGIFGMIGGFLVYFWRRGERAAIWASLCAGFWGGFGFAFATLLKLVEVKSGLQTNWHSALEQTYGFINGIGIAIAMWTLRRSAPILAEEGLSSWTNKFAFAFVLLGITYVNLSKNPEEWVKLKTMPALLYSVPAAGWFAAAYALLLLTLLWIIRMRPAFIPASALGRGQLLFLIFLWWMVVGNFERAVVAFAPQRLITEGVIFFNAIILTCLIIKPAPLPTIFATPFRLKRIVVAGVAALLFTSVGSWALVRGIYGDTFAGFANKHVRFGPDAPASGPTRGRAHP